MGRWPAQNFEEISQVVHAFCEEHHDLRIAVVTSGGTIVPLERNMGELSWAVAAVVPTGGGPGSRGG